MSQKKIPWIKRVFMSWASLEKYFVNDVNKQELKDREEELKKEIATRDKEIIELNLMIKEHEGSIKSLEQQINNKKEELAKAEAKAKEEIAYWKKSLEGMRKEHIDEQQKTRLDCNKQISRLEKELDKTKKEKQKLKSDAEAKINMANKEITKNKAFVLNKSEKIAELQSKLDEVRKHSHDAMEEISKKLEPLAVIDAKFFGSSGNKGKGELGELRLEKLLESSGMIEGMSWIKNLIIGKDTVEFALKTSPTEKKWIPIDSKVIDPVYIDKEKTKFLVDKKYADRIKTEVIKVKKYLAKANTTNYGILVLHNDQIYMQLFNERKEFFKEMIETHRVYIMSPSSFLQFAWSVGHILSLYRSYAANDKIYKDIEGLFSSIYKFGIKLEKVHKDFNIAMGHYNGTSKKYNRLYRDVNGSSEHKMKTLGEITTPLQIESKDEEK